MYRGNVIINADDFGETSQKNKAIIESFAKGLVSSTTIMANGEAFEEACQLAHDNRLVDRVGVHINVFTGKPLTEGVKRCRRLCNTNGEFDLNLKIGKRNWLPLTPKEKNALFSEITSQISRCRSQGLPIIHADSHHHQHNELSFLPIIVCAVRANHVRYLRPLRNMGAGICGPKCCYKRILNFQLRHRGLRGVDLFGDIDDFVFQRPRMKRDKNYCIEVMCHPQYAGGSQIVDLDRKPLADKINAISKLYPHLSATYYAELQDPSIAAIGQFVSGF